MTPGAKRHHPVVRVTHWVNVVALLVMVGSGLRIFNAYPAFAPRGGSFCCYPLAGHTIPAWLTFGGWLAGARNWHFAMMWVLVVNGLIYLLWIYLHGEWRDLAPARGDARDAWQMVRFYLFLRPDHPPQGKHNALQKLTYFGLPLIGIVAVLSGLAIWKPVSLGWLTGLMGGYVWARYWHFLAMLALVVLGAAHVFMVLAVDPWSIPSMVTGRYDEGRSPPARNARPFLNLTASGRPSPMVKAPGPAEEETPPVEEETPPVEEATSPVEEETPSVGEATSPPDEPAATADETPPASEHEEPRPAPPPPEET